MVVYYTVCIRPLTDDSLYILDALINKREREMIQGGIPQDSLYIGPTAPGQRGEIAHEFSFVSLAQAKQMADTVSKQGMSATVTDDDSGEVVHVANPR